MEVWTTTFTAGAFGGSYGLGYRRPLELTGARFGNVFVFAGAAAGWDDVDTFALQDFVSELEDTESYGDVSGNPNQFSPRGDGTYGWAGPVMLWCEGGAMENLTANPSVAAAAEAHALAIKAILPNADVMYYRIVVNPTGAGNPPPAANVAIAEAIGHACPSIYPVASGARDLTWMQNAVEYAVDAVGGGGVTLYIALNRTTSGWPSGLNKVPFLPTDEDWQIQLQAAQHTHLGFGVKRVVCYGDAISSKQGGQVDLIPYSVQQLADMELALVRQAVDVLAAPARTTLA